MKTFWSILKVMLLCCGCSCSSIRFHPGVGVLIEGDIMISERDDPWDRQNFLQSVETRRWPGGMVPFDYNKTAYTRLDIYVIQEGLKAIERDTCVRFVPRTDEFDYVYITPQDGCWSYLGRHGSGQVLSLSAPQCIDRGTVIHEFLHALGIGHEHSRPDRDQFVEVLWDNISEDKQPNFMKQKAYWQAWTGIPYDYMSVMHYSAFAFSKLPHAPTMKPKTPRVRHKDLGRAKTIGTLTKSDRLKIAALYNCAGELAAEN